MVGIVGRQSVGQRMRFGRLGKTVFDPPNIQRASQHPRLSSILPKGSVQVQRTHGASSGGCLVERDATVRQHLAHRRAAAVQGWRPILGCCGGAILPSFHSVVVVVIAGTGTHQILEIDGKASQHVTATTAVIVGLHNHNVQDRPTEFKGRAIVVVSSESTMQFVILPVGIPRFSKDGGMGPPVGIRFGMVMMRIVSGNGRRCTTPFLPGAETAFPHRWRRPEQFARTGDQTDVGVRWFCLSRRTTGEDVALNLGQEQMEILRGGRRRGVGPSQQGASV